MTGIQSLVLEVEDTAAAESFCKEAFELGDVLSVRESSAPTSGFRGFTVSLVVSQPGTVDALVRSALDAGASELKPVKKSFWGYAGVVQAPDGTIWKVATSAKKDTGPATREVDEVVLLLGVEDVKATKQFYADKGLSVGKSFGGKYAEFDTPGAAVKLALYPRKAAAKDAGVDPAGSGSHRVAVAGDAGAFTDPDGFVWESGA
ncbi:MAG TPA: glyoxalase [Nocardioides sp.]|nr:glyoxalase [Nocardioides sp.]